jgi:hypothetical protein
MRKIPLKNVPSQIIKVVLAEQNCQLKVYYRFGSMYMDIIVGGQMIQAGAICRNRTSIVQVANDIFVGSLHFLDLLGDADPNWEGFGDRFSLLYVEPNEDIPKGFDL